MSFLLYAVGIMFLLADIMMEYMKHDHRSIVFWYAVIGFTLTSLAYIHEYSRKK
jgi:hypothetical protein